MLELADARYLPGSEPTVTLRDRKTRCTVTLTGKAAEQALAAVRCGRRQERQAEWRRLWEEARREVQDADW